MIKRKHQPEDEARADSAAPVEDSAGTPGTDASDELEALHTRIAELEAERDELSNKALRALADFQNYQRRAAGNETEAKRQGVGGVVRSVLSAMDHFDLALQQDPEQTSGASVLEGVRVIRDEMLKALELHGVTTIAPELNDEFNPGHHEGVLQQPAEGVDPGRVSMLLQHGYALGDRVLRPAKVAVAPETED